MPRPLAGTPVVDKKKVHDLVLWEIEKRYTRTAVKLTTGEYEIGEILVNPAAADEVVGSQPTFSDAICLENITIEAGDGEVSVPVLVRGPALLNLDEIVRADDDETDAELITRLLDLRNQGVRFVREPVEFTTSGRDS